MTNNLSFGERTKRMSEIALQLAAIAAELTAEAARMQAAADRFEKRRVDRQTKKAA